MRGDHRGRRWPRRPLRSASPAIPTSRPWCSRSCSGSRVRTLWTPAPALPDRHRVLGQAAPRSRRRPARRLAEPRGHPGLRTGPARRHRRHRRARHRGQLGICRVLGLPARLAILVACGNAICGNSAIAAVAPVIGADSQGHRRRDRLHRRARRADGARPAAVRPARRPVRQSVRGAGGAHRLRGAAGAGRHGAGQPAVAPRSAPWSSWCAC